MTNEEAKPLYEALGHCSKCGAVYHRWQLAQNLCCSGRCNNTLEPDRYGSHGVWFEYSTGWQVQRKNRHNHILLNVAVNGEIFRKSVI
jgi:hypothetical protein